MKHTNIARVSVLLVGVVLAALVWVAMAAGQKAEERLQTKEDDYNEFGLGRGTSQRNDHEPRITVAPVLNFSDRSVPPAAGSMLARTRGGVFMTLNTSGLEAGTAATAWWVIFNNPRACATRPCSVADLPNPAVQSSLINAAGRLIGADGAASYGDFIAVGDTTGGWTGPGLLDAFKAEIHLVTRTHGPAILFDPIVLGQQLSMFNGGCPPNTCLNLQVSIHRP